TETETAPAGVVEFAGLEPAIPGPLVVLGREVVRAGPAEEGVPDAGRVPFVARAPRGGGDVHDVAPALLVLDRGHAVDHVAVPPDRVARPYVGDAGQGPPQQRAA